MRRITIDLTAAVQQHAGLGRYAEELARALVRLGAAEELRVFSVDPAGRPPAPPLDVLPHRQLRWAAKRWRFTVLAASHLNRPMDDFVGESDLFHATDNLLPPLGRQRSVFTLHDLIFLRHPQTHTPLNLWYQRLMIPRFLRQADAVICVSEHTRQDAVRYYHLDESKLRVIPEGVDPSFRPVEAPGALEAVRTRYGLPERFVLFVGTIEPRKNLVTLWEAYRALRMEGRTEKLAVVGRKGWLYEPILARLRDLGLEDEVVFPGYVAEEDLPLLYAAATCFCFPSLYEGFGLPPLEAMAAGCPVVCSDASSLPEVCGDAALLVPPTDVAALTAALRRVLDDAELRATLRERGLRRAAGLTWRTAAERTLEIYRAFAGSDAESASSGR